MAKKGTPADGGQFKSHQPPEGRKWVESRDLKIGAVARSKNRRDREISSGCPVSYSIRLHGPIVGPKSLGTEFAPEAPRESMSIRQSERDIVYASRQLSRCRSASPLVWRGMIRGGRRGISSQSFTSLAVAQSLRVRCGPMWADVCPMWRVMHIGRDLVEIFLKLCLY